MANGMWTAVSGATARSMQVDSVANNLANAETSGYKKTAPAFKEYLSIEERQPYPIPPYGQRITYKDLHPLDGKDQSFVTVDGTYTDFKQGNLKVTNQPHDFAIQGPGFFEVLTPEGVRFTKAGSFRVAHDGKLVTGEGYPVLSPRQVGLATALPVPAVQPNQGGLSTQGGVAAEQQLAEAQSRIINVGPRARVHVSEEGDIFSGEAQVGKMSVVEFIEPQKLLRDKEQLFQNVDMANFKTEASGSKVLQGVIETSNVNAVEEMTKLIQAHRLFEQDMKSIQTFNQMMEKESNEVGRL